MVKIKLRAIDPFKQLALARLAKKSGSNQYPITERDLLHIFQCPSCKSSDLKNISEVSLPSGLIFFRTNICDNCLLVFRSISPSFSWFKKCWKIINTGKLEVFNPDAEKYKRKRYQEYLTIMKKYINKGVALEIGSGYGSGARIFQKAGFRMQVIEPEISKANYIQKHLKIPVIDNDIDHFLQNTSNKYDLILFSNCLEHLDYPVKIMQRLKNILKPEGFVLLAVPILWDFVTWTDSLYLTHKTNFNQEHLLALASRSGFKIVEMKQVPYFFDSSKELAIVLTRSEQTSILSIQIPKKQRTKLIAAIESQYRKNFPISTSVIKKGVIRYQVPYIDQFFQTINLEDKIITPPKSPGKPIIISEPTTP